MKHVSLILAFVLLVSALFAQSNDGNNLVEESTAAKSAFLEKDPGLAKFFKNSHGYVIFPNVVKGAFIVGGAGGEGVVYEKGKMIGTAKMTQLSVGAQAGGQAYREVVFFETKEVMNRFKADKVEFSAEVTAVAASEGASLGAEFMEGLAIFTMAKGGLIASAAIAGQKFKFTPSK